MNIKIRRSSRLRPQSCSLGRSLLKILMLMMDQLAEARRRTPLQMKLLYVLDVPAGERIRMTEGRIKLWGNQGKKWLRKPKEEEKEEAI